MYNHNVRQDSFRSDINGLRAWAVLAVVFFHFAIPGFDGGYVGVDIFFVISGFLMTKIIITGLEGKDKNFVLMDFYLSRAKRIMPALVVLCTLLLVIGWFFLAPPDYKELGVHAASAVVFLSNFKFWRESGYFESSSHEKLLLHTWSLSAEWQFYLILPLLLIGIWHIAPGRIRVLKLYALGIILSFGYSVIATKISPSYSFYLLPTRVWEMLAGGGIYLVGNSFLSDSQKRLLETLGFAMIIMSILFLSPNDPWPGSLALFPVVGASCILLASRTSSKWTSARLIQLVGNWSYSIYLWHWPITVGLLYLGLNDQPIAVVTGIMLSLLLGWLSYRFIESPIRNTSYLRSKVNIITVIGTSSALVFSVGAFAYLKQGVLGRLPLEVESAARESGNFNSRRDECHLSKEDDFHGCTYGGDSIKVVLIGDSHANTLATAVQAALPSTEDGVLVFSYTGCPTISGATKHEPKLKCAEFNEWVTQQISKIDLEIPIIIANRLTHAAFGEPVETGTPTIYFLNSRGATGKEFLSVFQENLTDRVCKISSDRKSVYMLRPIPEMPNNVPRALSRALLLGRSTDISVDFDKYKERHAQIWKMQDFVKSRCGVGTLDPTPFLCPGQKCIGHIEGRPIYYDDNHLSEYGNKLLVPMFNMIFQEVKKPKFSASVNF